MKAAEHNATAPSARTDLLVMPSVLGRQRGSSASSLPRRRDHLSGNRALSVFMGCTTVMLAALLFVATASASFTHFLEPSSSFPFSEVNKRTVEAIAVDQADHLVYTSGRSTITKYTTAGQLANFSALSSPTLPLPQGAKAIAVDSSGDIYLAGDDPAVIYKYLPSGEPDPATPEIGAGFIPQHGTAGIGVNVAGDLYVAANTNGPGGTFEKAEVDEFAPNGELLNSFGSGVFTSDLGGLALDSAGNVYVAAQNGTFAFDGGGACLNACAPIDSRNPRAIAVEPGTDYVYVVHPLSTTSEVVEYDSAANGNAELGSFGTEDLSSDKFGHGEVVGVAAKGLAVDGATGDVYVPIETSTRSGSGDEAFVPVFGPNVVIPTLHTGAPSNLQPTSIGLHGTVNTAGTEPEDALTGCHFDYVTEEAFLKAGFSDLSSGGEAPCEPSFGSIPNDSGDHAVAAALTGLSPATTYRFRLFAENENGHNQKEGEPFTTAGPPLVDAQSVDGIDQGAGVLHAKINPFELGTNAHFEYISAADYQANGGSFAGAHPATPTTVENIGQGLGDQGIEAQLTGLAPATEYHYRAVAENSALTVHGPDQTFTTVSPVLFALQAPTDITSSAVTLRVYINPLGRQTSYHFEYGKSTGYGNLTTEAEAGEGTGFGLHSVVLAGLQAGTEYHFRTVATNSSLGTATSPDFTFTTEPASCPNEALRQEDSSTHLPDCRAYEQVSPEQKGLAPVAGGVDVPPSGPTEHVLFAAEGSFAGDNFGTGFGSPYLARRTSTGWTAESLTPPPSLGMSMFTQLIGVNSSLTEVLTSPIATGEFARNVNTADVAPSGTMYLRRPDGSFAPASPLLSTVDGSSLHDAVFGIGFVDANPDLSQVVFGSKYHALLPSVPSAALLYEMVDGESPSPQLRIINLDNGGSVLPPCGESGLWLGGQGSGSNIGRYANEISADGSKVFFGESSAALPPGTCASAIEHLLARVGGQTTIDLANPGLNDECTTGSCRTATLQSATFQGASADGSKAFFTSAQQLTNVAHQEVTGAGEFKGCSSPLEGPNGCNLYEYDFARPAGHSLVALSALQSAGVNARVRAVVGSAHDGSLVYLIARGLLTNQPNALGQTAQAGAENLYVVNTETGSVSFIAVRCTGTEASGDANEVAQCPGSGADETNATHYDLTPDGGFLLFSTYAQLVPDDTNQAADLYRYDAQTESLLRVSIGHNGEDSNGNGGGQDASTGVSNFLFQMLNLAANNSHAISEDGSTIVFTTARPLQEGAESGISNVYAWRQGQVSLISNGRGGGEPVVSPSGEDIFFGTEQGLIPSQDPDEVRDYYDARIGGGFPLAKPPPVPCESPEGCGRHVGPEPPPPTLGTPEFRGPSEGPNHPRCNKGFVLKGGHCVKKHRRHKKRHRKGAGSKHGGGK